MIGKNRPTLKGVRTTMYQDGYLFAVNFLLFCLLINYIIVQFHKKTEQRA